MAAIKEDYEPKALAGEVLASIHLLMACQHGARRAKRADVPLGVPGRKSGCIHG